MTEHTIPPLVLDLAHNDTERHARARLLDLAPVGRILYYRAEHAAGAARMTHWLRFYVAGEGHTISEITGLMCRAFPDCFTWHDKREAIRTRGSETGAMDCMQRLSIRLYRRYSAFQLDTL